MQALQRLRSDLFQASREGPQLAAWWENVWLWLGLAVFSTLPFLLSPLPPMADMFSHIARYHVMTDGGRSEVLQSYYSFHWTLIGNLGHDLLVYVLAPVMGVKNAAFLTVSLVPPLTVLGIRQLSMAVHGRVHPGALVALPFVYSFPFLYGFINYSIGIMGCLWSLALWCKWRNGLNPFRIGVLVVIGSLLWLIHMAAWAVTVVAIGSIELAHGLHAHGWRPFRVIWQAFFRTLPIASIPVLLTLFWRSGVAALPSTYTLLKTLELKVYWIAFIIRDQSMLLDLGTLVLVGLATLWLLYKRNRIDPGLTIAAIIMLVLFWVLPLTVFNSYFADLRLLGPIAIFVLVAFDSNRLSPRARNALAALALCVFAVRMGMTTYGWVDRGYALKDDLRAMDHIRPGARIAALVPDRMFESWNNSGLSHLPSMAIVDRNAFTNTEWEYPGSQLMRPIYNTGHDFNNNASAMLKMRAHRQGRTVEDFFDKLPRDRFDYVWLFKTDVPPRQADGLQLKFRNRESVLYAIVPKAGAVTPRR